MVVLGAGVRTGSACKLKATRSLLGGCDVLMLDVVRVAQGCESTKNYSTVWSRWGTVHFKGVDCMLCELYGIKLMKKLAHGDMMEAF